MNAILKTSILSALLLAFLSTANADTITLNSAGGSSNFINGTLQFLGTSPLNASFVSNNNSALIAGTAPTTNSSSSTSYNVDSNGVWANAIAGTKWVSNSPNAGPSGSGNANDGTVIDPNNFYYYQTTFTAVGGVARYNGSISVMADDTLEVLLNGAVIVPFGIVAGDSHCANNPPSCGSPDTVSLSGILLNSGTNTLTIIDAQTGLVGAGVDFTANLTQTPEPSSMVLLASGLIGLAFVGIRQLKPASAVIR